VIFSLFLIELAVRTVPPPPPPLNFTVLHADFPNEHFTSGIFKHFLYFAAHSRVDVSFSFFFLLKIVFFPLPPLNLYPPFPTFNIGFPFLFFSPPLFFFCCQYFPSVFAVGNCSSPYNPPGLLFSLPANIYQSDYPDSLPLLRLSNLTRGFSDVANKLSQCRGTAHSPVLLD